MEPPILTTEAERQDTAAFARTAAVPQAGRPIRVFVMDLWCYTPYYDRYLCESLNWAGVAATLGSVSYYKDPAYLANCGMSHDPGLLDIVPKLRLSNQTLRRALMLVESCINMVALLVRFMFSKPDIVHVEWIPLARRLPFELWFLRIAKAMGIALVYTVHDVLPHGTGQRYKTLYRKIYQRMDKLICHTDETKNNLVTDFSISPDRVTVIPHGPLFQEGSLLSHEDARAQRGFPNGVCIVLWQGILRPYKGLDFLLEAWQKIQQAGLNAKLVIAGPGSDPSEEQRVQDHVAKREIGSSVQLDLKFIPVEELPSYYQAADVIVYPYSAITTSGALMTGLGYKKPVVTTALPCFLEIFGTRERATMVKYGDVSGLAEILRRLILDPAERKRLALAQAASFESCAGWPEIAQRTRQCYERVLRDRPRGSHSPHGTPLGDQGSTSCA